MALGFGRKKAADDTAVTPDAMPDIEAAPVAAHAPSSPPNDAVDAFDLDAFAVTPPTNTPVGAAVEPDPFGDLGVAPSSATTADSGSAFEFPDFETVPPTEMTSAATNADTTASHATPLNAREADTPDFDKLYAIEQAQAAQNATGAAAPVPLVPPSATMQEDAAPFYEPQVPVSAEIESEVASQPKKKLPLVPILGALAVLALAGGGAAYFSGQSATEEDESTVSSPSQTVSRADAPIQSAPSTQNAPAGTAPLPGASPRLAPPSVNPVSPGIAPVSAQMTQMKALWKQGADAKHRRDYAAARKFWNQGLKMEPTNSGFLESLAKLPK